MKTKAFIGTLVGLALCTLAIGPASAGPLATLQAGPAAIEWQPALQEAGLTLTVSGPEGFYLRQDFAPGQGPSFSVYDEGGNLRPAGVYVWELRAVHTLDEGSRQELEGVRSSGDEGALQKAGKLPAGPTYQSGSFSILEGAIVAGGEKEPGPAAAGGPVLAPKATINDSLCVGFDCPAAPSFSDTTILMMENNTRIKFGDTSVSPFPNNDWEIEANSSTSGALSYLGFNDCGTADNDGGCATDLVFAVEAGARQNALYVEGDGDVGIGTSNPAVDLHIVKGDSPALRLEQDGSSGFGSQTWDIAGNETNFFVRDVTGASGLPFRIFPGAGSSALVIDGDGEVGIGTAAPGGQLHIENTGGDDADDFIVTADGQLTIGSTNAGGLPTLMKLTNPVAGTGGGAVRFVLENSSADQWSFTNDNVAGGELEINFIPNAGTEVVIDGSGNVTATSFNPTSSRSLKDDLEPIDPQEVLLRLANLPITTWKFIQEEDDTRHLGPMAEDFREAFGLGDSAKTINLTDANGVAFAAIQGLHEKVVQLEAERAMLSSRSEELERLGKQLREANAELSQELKARDGQIADLSERLVRLEAAIEPR